MRDDNSKCCEFSDQVNSSEREFRKKAKSNEGDARAIVYANCALECARLLRRHWENCAACQARDAALDAGTIADNRAEREVRG
jgi:hypothetical protein